MITNSFFGRDGISHIANKSESGQALLIAIVLVGLGTLAIYIIFAPIFEALFAGLF